MIGQVLCPLRVALGTARLACGTAQFVEWINTCWRFTCKPEAALPRCLATFMSLSRDKIVTRLKLLSSPVMPTQRRDARSQCCFTSTARKCVSKLTITESPCWTRLLIDSRRNRVCCQDMWKIDTFPPSNHGAVPSLHVCAKQNPTTLAK